MRGQVDVKVARRLVADSLGRGSGPLQHCKSHGAKILLITLLDNDNLAGATGQWLERRTSTVATGRLNVGPNCQNLSFAAADRQLDARCNRRPPKSSDCRSQSAPEARWPTRGFPKVR